MTQGLLGLLLPFLAQNGGGDPRITLAGPHVEMGGNAPLSPDSPQAHALNALQVGGGAAPDAGPGLAGYLNMAAQIQHAIGQQQEQPAPMQPLLFPGTAHPFSLWPTELSAPNLQGLFAPFGGR